MPEHDGERPPLTGCRIVLGVCGGIAAYKSAELVRHLRKSGADVAVLMTPGAARFVTPLTLSTLSGKEVETDLFAGGAVASWTRHVDLGTTSDLIVIAPATANTIAKLAGGFCDNLLTATVLAARCPVLVFPAMDHDMYLHPATERNLETLRKDGYEIVPPEYGPLASGLVGWGRMPEPENIVRRICMRLGRTGEPLFADSSLAGKTILVTAGPTREAIDPVRFLSNHSTGTMGFALAGEAARRGGQVVLVAGPTRLPTPPGLERIDVVSADDMYAAVLAHRDADVVIAAAAVADFAPAETHTSKVKKEGAALEIRLRRTPDILAEIGAHDRAGQIRIGF
ncbi:MAG TPA: bifunctional phosphopantothenoylcysteine decarboxylase/phosphopantothenate--cysteine ligase CoaBC, partial [Rhodothermales bacterium]